MTLVWNPWAFGLALAGLIAWAIAGIVFHAGRTAQNRWLAALLFFEGSNFLATSIRFAATDQATVHAGAMVNMMALGPSVAAYIGILATLRTPLVGRLTHRGAAAAFLILVAAHEVTLFARPDLYIAGTGHDPLAAGLEFVPGPLLNLLSPLIVVFYLYAMAAAISAWRRADPGAPRQRAKAFALAFILRDGLMVVAILALVTSKQDSVAMVATNWSAWVGSLVAFAVLAGYGIVRHQLFDIDLKIKFGIRRGTVAAIIAATALVGSELLEAALGIDQVIPAVLIGAAMGLAFRPLSRLGDRLADKALPGVEDTPEYRSHRARDVYRAAYESALQDGVVTNKERDVLATLATSLGLPSGDVRTIEKGAT